MTLPMLLIPASMPVLLITPGLPWIIFTWVITLIPHGVSGTVITAGSLSGSVSVTLRGITRITTMATIRHGMPRIITILIILPGGRTEDIAHTTMVVAITITTIVTVIGMIIMRGIIIGIIIMTGTTAMPGVTIMTTIGATVPVKTAVAIVVTPSAATRIVQEAKIHP